MQAVIDRLHRDNCELRKDLEFMSSALIDESKHSRRLMETLRHWQKMASVESTTNKGWNVQHTITPTSVFSYEE
jgi:hypothetical protein